MFREIFWTLGLVLLPAFVIPAQNITVDGVADRTTYTDTASFRVQTNAGFTYQVTLNGAAVPAGATNRITRMDYYDLAVRRTETATSFVTNALVRFIVLSSNRGDPERGLIDGHLTRRSVRQRPSSPARIWKSWPRRSIRKTWKFRWWRVRWTTRTMSAGPTVG